MTDVKIGEVIGNGYFGQVYKGSWYVTSVKMTCGRYVTCDRNGTPVALKTIKREGYDEDGRKWKEEIALLQ